MTMSYPFNHKTTAPHHEVYNSYTFRLGLSEFHALGLKERGLTDDAIKKGQYATKPNDKSVLASSALAHIVRSYSPEGVAGFSKDPSSGNWQAAKVFGLMIPVRNVDGKITSFQVRNDNPKLGKDGKPKNKYLAFSTAEKPSGGKVFNTTHCPILKGVPKKVCGHVLRITEGVLKADVATALGDVYCVGMQGLRPADDTRSVIESLEVSTLLVALDAGEDQNIDMISCKIKLIRLAQEIGIDVHIEVWDRQYGKGIDDVLASGNRDKIRNATEDEIKALLDSAEQKPLIITSGGRLSEEATIAEQALIKSGKPVYQRGKELVTPVTRSVDASNERQTSVAVMHAISKARLNDLICQAAHWYRFDKEVGKIQINPPAHVAETLMDRFGAWNFPELVGVLVTPTLRPDGSVLDQIGYDPATRLFLAARPPMKEIPEAPSREDALAELRLLDALLEEFPFANDASRSVALSALMTPVLRGACSVVPMHVISAPMPGSGKSYLMDTVAAIALGHPCPVISSRKNDENELEKRLDAAVLSGQSIISIDNFNGDLGSDSLCQHIERPRVNIRVLGQSVQIGIESRSCLFATGNNIRLLGDLTRRVIQCTLDAKDERPEMRRFKMNPVDTVLADRGKYIAAILIIARAYIVAGRPDTVFPRLASFEAWSDLVRSSLVWLGRADPLDTMSTIRAEDPTRQIASELFSAIWECTLGKPFTSKEIIAMVTLEQHDIGLPPKQEALREALVNAVGDRRGIFLPREVGKWLGRHKGTIYNGIRLNSEVDGHGHPATWWLEKSGSEDQGGYPEGVSESDNDLTPFDD